MPDKKIVLIENDITKLLKKDLKDLKKKELLEKGDFKVQITVDIKEKIYKQVDEFPKLQQALTDLLEKLVIR